MIYDENGLPLPEDPWSSIVDLMSALVLVLFLAVIFFVTNFSEVSAALEVERETLETRSVALQNTQKKLNSANAQNLDLIAREERLNAEKKSLIDEKQSLMSEKQGLISEKQGLISEKKGLISEREGLVADKAKLESQQSILIKDRDDLAADRASLLREQEALKAERVRLLEERTELRTESQRLLGDKKRLLGDKSALTSEAEKLNAKVLALQSAIKEAASKQSRLMEGLATSFKESNAQGVSIDREGGKIILKSEVLFAKGESSLTPSGQESVQQVLKSLLKVLKSNELKDQVEGIMVEGHTSSSGDDITNLNLSAERAINTLEYILSSSQLQSSSRRVQKLFFAGAFGESRPVLTAGGQENSVKSRRIEIRLLFNQSQVKSLAHAISQ